MNEIEQLEAEIAQKIARLGELRRGAARAAVPNYTFSTLEGDVHLLDLFAGQSRLLAIHNMGQGCRYCTLWADGINAFLPHLESALAVVLLSKDPPAAQRAMANARGWRFRTASHGGGDYIREQSVIAGQDNMPGVVCYERQGDQILKMSSAVFGPGDLYCSLWHLLRLAGIGEEDWTPQYSYWKRPPKLDDGGLKLIE
jgi:predicted dithiol-disulfide oxidoreductase (DUF899 family)